MNNILLLLRYHRYNGASAVINWLLNFDLNNNANQAILNVSAHDKTLSRFHSHQHYYSSSVKPKGGDRNNVSKNTGSLYSYNQSEFYFNTPKVIWLMYIQDPLYKLIL